MSANRANSPFGIMESFSNSANVVEMKETVAPPSIVMSKRQEPTLTLRKRLGMGVMEPSLGEVIIELRQGYTDWFIDWLITLEAPLQG